MHDDIVGTWTYDYFKNGVSVYKRQDRMDYKKANFVFKKEGNVTYRRNESDCGTPPISYQNYYGNWELSKDSIITVSYNYNRKEVKQEWKLIAISKDSLVVEYR